MKKVIAITVALLFILSTSVCFAKGVSSSSGRSVSSSSSSKSISSFSSSKPSTSGISSNTKTTSAPYTSGGGISTTKTQQKEQMAKDNHANLQTTARNSYYNSHQYVGYNSWGTGFFTGMMAGSLFHPWSMVTPMGAGYGYAQAPISMMLLYLFIDFVFLSLFIYFVYWMYKKFRN